MIGVSGGLQICKNGRAVSTGEERVMSKPESATLQVGDRAPLFSLPNQKGGSVSLADAIARGPVLLGFHRGTW
jgi:hypothetical protein